MSRRDELADALAVRMLAEASVPVSVASLALVMPEAVALAESVIRWEDQLARARRRIAELIAVSGADQPRVVGLDLSRFTVALAGRSSGAVWSPEGN